MKTHQSSPALLTLATLGLLVLLPESHARDTGHPVCAPANDVRTILGRSAPDVLPVHCGVERKVTQGTSGPRVAEILGRASATPAQPSADTPVIQAQGAGSRAVEWVLGRAAGDPAKPRLFTPELAQPTVR